MQRSCPGAADSTEILGSLDHISEAHRAYGTSY
jgi:hypothetical protein